MYMPNDDRVEFNGNDYCLCGCKPPIHLTSIEEISLFKDRSYIKSYGWAIKSQELLLDSVWLTVTSPLELFGRQGVNSDDATCYRELLLPIKFNGSILIGINEVEESLRHPTIHTSFFGELKELFFESGKLTGQLERSDDIEQFRELLRKGTSTSGICRFLDSTFVGFNLNQPLVRTCLVARIPD